MPMSALLEEVSRIHHARPPATQAQIEAFEQSVGWRLDPDLRAFYLHCDGADLFDRVDPAFSFFPLSQLRRARVVMRKDDTDRAGPASWYALCEVRDSNYILLDVSEKHGDRYPIRDGYNEAFPDPAYCRQIASSFSEFLEGALRSNERWFWLREDT
ncbi:SMI1/KNR4 family protein [Corallococcus praedator]|uniref:SMI1/KNR4 family protein n=1 Tax=Corallococcus praedator TaxID=2316724 RepID=A0ABX9Q712_9BACT|nr:MULTISPECIES: SMI1/KNR4 family protein [Corallococcus]RKH17250.1 SMI1/KNR4 family protein [Corallococcus sp. CA047B]RKH25520.1 SMI1/KNR4 family protein [Corallococcus sp. CA031C]RKH92922.1 SMI1/KNR4 family protein [Corallococcus praedator]